MWQIVWIKMGQQHLVILWIKNTHAHIEYTDSGSRSRAMHFRWHWLLSANQRQNVMWCVPLHLQPNWICLWKIFVWLNTRCRERWNTFAASAMCLILILSYFIFYPVAFPVTFSTWFTYKFRFHECWYSNYTACITYKVYSACILPLHFYIHSASCSGDFFPSSFALISFYWVFGANMWCACLVQTGKVNSDRWAK